MNQREYFETLRTITAFLISFFVCALWIVGSLSLIAYVALSVHFVFLVAVVGWVFTLPYLGKFFNIVGKWGDL